jgi:hypothetical protein
MQQSGWSFVEGETWEAHVTRLASVLCAHLKPTRQKLVVRVWTAPTHFYSVRYDAADAGVSGVYSECWCLTRGRASGVVPCSRVPPRDQGKMHALVDRALFHFEKRGFNMGVECGALRSSPEFCASVRTVEPQAHEFSFYAGTSDGFDAFGATCPESKAAVHTYELS